VATSKRELKWTAGDVLDLEILGASVEGPQGSAKDRAELEREFAPQPLTQVPRGQLFRRWLERRRPNAPGLPGATLDRVFRVARVLGWMLGLGIGASTAGGYLLYFGQQPVNPFWFFLWLVLVPLLISAAIIAVAAAWHDWSGPGALARWLVGAVCRRLPGGARQAWEAWSGNFARHRDRHGRLAVLPLLGITQRAACGFALGALGTLWLRVVFTDIAFGWQSSAGWSMETWHGIARAIASPWSWLMPGACPTVEQVRDSHFTFAGGMKEIVPSASQAWWPFLAASLAVWGVGVRAAIIVLIGWHERKALRNPDFSHSDANALHRALTGPLFVAQPSGVGLEVKDSAPAPVPHAAGRAWLVLAPDSEPPSATAVAQALLAGVGGTSAAVQPLTVDDAGANESALAAVRQSTAPVALLLPAARDPILAIKKTLAAVLAACAGRECVVLLQGAPERVALWRKFAAANRLEMELISVP